MYVKITQNYLLVNEKVGDVGIAKHFSKSTEQGMSFQLPCICNLK